MQGKQKKNVGLNPKRETRQQELGCPQVWRRELSYVAPKGAWARSGERHAAAGSPLWLWLTIFIRVCYTNFLQVHLDFISLYFSPKKTFFTLSVLLTLWFAASGFVLILGFLTVLTFHASSNTDSVLQLNKHTESAARGLVIVLSQNYL